jgi:hypothetical protein
MSMYSSPDGAALAENRSDPLDPPESEYGVAMLTVICFGGETSVQVIGARAVLGPLLRSY